MKCIICNKETTDDPTFCSPKCEETYILNEGKIPLCFIDLDTMINEPKPGIFTMPNMMKFLQQEEIKFELLEWNGPGGGWPIIRFTGTKEALAQLCDEYYDDKGLMEFVEEVS